MKLHSLIHLSNLDKPLLINPHLRTLVKEVGGVIEPLKLKLNTKLSTVGLTPYKLNTTVEEICKTLYLTGNSKLYLELTRDTDFLLLTVVRLNS
jgi:hypothetical protein